MGSPESDVPKNAQRTASKDAPKHPQQTTGAVKSLTSFYLRMNGDNEKDYAFALPSDAPVSRIYDIFHTLPVVLSPYYFREPIPTGFAVSVHPGCLTSEGSMLFHEDADDEKYIQKISDDALIGEVIGTDMLVVPLFPWSQRRQLVVLSVLMGWLYLDLPQHITPTPGVAPTMALTRALSALFPNIVGKDLQNFKVFSSAWWGWGFFFVHCLKIAFIYLLFRVGVINPRSLNPRKSNEGPQMSSLSAEKLRSLGWMGARRAPPADFTRRHRDLIIANSESILAAHRSGQLSRRDVLVLQNGEGWSVWARGVDPKLRKTGPNFLNAENKFVVSDTYLACLADHARKLYSEIADNPQKLENFSRDLLRYGFLEGPEKLRDLYKELYAARYPDAVR